MNCLHNIVEFFSDRKLIWILLLGLAMRIPQLADPVLDGDSFRQGADASIAWNYYTDGFNLFHPAISGWGTLEEPGLWPNEFPLYPFIISLLYIPFGVHEIIGRIVSVLFCLVGAVALYDFIRRLDDIITARYATLWYLIAPQFIYHGRCFHRFPMALAFMIMALALYTRWLENRSGPAYAGMIACAAIALLMMPPLILFAVPFILLYKPLRGISIWRDRWIWLSAILMLLPSFFWYSWAIQQPGSFSLNSGGRETFRNWWSLKYYSLWWEHELFRKVWRALWEYTLGPLGAAAALIGLFLPKGSLARIPLLWVAATLVYYMVDVHPIAISTHYIYFLVILPPLCWSAARLCRRLCDALQEESMIPSQKMARCFTAIIIFATLFHWQFMFKEWYRTKDHWQPAIDAVRENVPPEARIVVDLFDPSFMYYAQRKGLAKSTVDITVEAVQEWEKQGAAYLVIMDQQNFFHKEALRVYLKQTAANVLLNDYVRIYKLRGKVDQIGAVIETP